MMDYEFIEHSGALDKLFFAELHNILHEHRHLDDRINWWGDSITLDGTYSIQELKAVIALMERFRADYARLHNDMA